MDEFKNAGWLPEADVILPGETPIDYFQICAFAGMDKKHLVRKFRFTMQGKYESIKNYKLTKYAYDKFKRDTPQRQYKEFSTFDLCSVPYPVMGEVLMAKMTTKKILTQNENKSINYSTFRVFPSDITFS